MEKYESPDLDELGRISVEGVEAFVITIDDGGFSDEDNHSIEVVEGIDTYFVLVNREMVERAMEAVGDTQEGKMAVMSQILGVAAGQLMRYLHRGDSVDKSV